MNIGKTIADLRKLNNMTQSEVADILGVSYQAVSKWERNESLPDITLLPQIADLFHITIDQLLRGGLEFNKEETIVAKEIVEEVNNSSLNDDITEFVNKQFEMGNPSSDELADSISNFVENRISNTFTNAFEGLMPFMKPNKIKDVVKRHKANVKSFSKKGYHYLDDETIVTILENIDEMDDEVFDLLISIASNASKDIRELIVEKLCENDLEGLDMSDIMLYLDSEQKMKVLTYCLDNDYIDCDQLIDCLPFTNSCHKEIILNYLLENEDGEDYLEEVLPFLNHEQISNLFLDNINNFDIDTIIDCAPLLPSEVLHEVVMNSIKNSVDEYLEDLYPFISMDTKKELLKYYSMNKMYDELSTLTDYMM